MKVLLINGSPHEKGCTYTALSLIAGELKAQGIETEILHVGGQPVLYGPSGLRRRQVSGLQARRRLLLCPPRWYHLHP